MELTVIGSGSSGNCYRVQDGDHTLLLEAGLPFKQMREALGFHLSQLSGCLVSHSHGDHAKGVKDLLKAGVDCYLHTDTAQEVGVSGHRVHRLDPLQTVRVGPFAILPFPLNHDVPNYGYLIARAAHKLVYITDTFYCRYRFNGVTIFAIECNYASDILRTNIQQNVLHASLGQRIRQTHMSLETVKGFLRANDLSQVEAIWLLHLSDKNADEDRFKREISELTGKPTYIA